MRDIREDLEERLRTIELQLGGTNTWFDQRIEQVKKELEQIKTERDSKLAELKRELEVINRVLQFEQQRWANSGDRYVERVR